jgi:hypothetical protein
LERHEKLAWDVGETGCAGKPPSQARRDQSGVLEEDHPEGIERILHRKRKAIGNLAYAVCENTRNRTLPSEEFASNTALGLHDRAI